MAFYVPLSYYSKGEVLKITGAALGIAAKKAIIGIFEKDKR